MQRRSLPALTLLLAAEEERIDRRCREGVLHADGQWRQLPLQVQTDDGTFDSAVQHAKEVAFRWRGTEPHVHYLTTGYRYGSYTEVHHARNCSGAV